MRKSLLKTVVTAAAVVASSLIMSAAVWAGTTTTTYEYTMTPSTNTGDFFDASTSKNSQSTFQPSSLQSSGFAVPNRTPGLIVTEALKFNSSGYLRFTLKDGETAELTFYVCGKEKTFNTQILKGDTQVALYPASGKYDYTTCQELTYSATEPGTYTIKQNSSEQSLLYAKAVVTSQTSDDSEATLTASKSSISIDETLQLSSNIQKFTKSSDSYESSDISVATVDANGLVTAISAGETTITYTAKGSGTKDGEPISEISAEITITVTEPVTATNLTLSKSELSLFVGKSETVTASVEPNGVTSSVDWASNNAAVATVKDGKITAVKAGTAVITASIDGLEKEVNVIVKDVINFQADDTVIWEMKEYTENDLSNGLTFIPTTNKDNVIDTISVNNSSNAKFTDDNGDVYSYTSTSISYSQNDSKFQFVPTSNGKLTVLVKVNSGKSGNIFGTSVEGTSEKTYFYITKDVTEGTEYTASLSGSKAVYYYIGFTPASEETETIANTVKELPSSSDDFYAVGDSETYVIHGLTEKDIDDDYLKLVDMDTISVSDNSKETTSINTTITKVFKAIKFSDDSSVSAGEGKFANYKALYGMRLTSNGEDSFILDTDNYTYSLNWITGKNE